MIKKTYFNNLLCLLKITPLGNQRVCSTTLYIVLSVEVDKSKIDFFFSHYQDLMATRNS